MMKETYDAENWYFKTNDDLVECHVSSEEHTVITYIQVDAGRIEV